MEKFPRTIWTNGTDDWAPVRGRHVIGGLYRMSVGDPLTRDEITAGAMCKRGGKILWESTEGSLTWLPAEMFAGLVEIVGRTDARDWDEVKKIAGL